MSAIGPYTPSYDYRFMYDQPDLRGIITPKIRGNNILSFLSNNKGFDKFLALVKTAKLEGMLCDMKNALTIFVPRDESIDLPIEYFQTMSIHTAKMIVLFSTLFKSLNFTVLSSSPSIRFNTKLPSNLLKVITINGKTTLHGCTTITKPDILLDNGIVHIVDNLLVPEAMAVQIF